MIKSRTYFKIYASWRHLLFTLFLVFLPFGFMIFFSRYANIAKRILWHDFLLSFYRLTLAYVIAALAGWILAVSFYRGKKAAVFLPIFDVLQSFPAFAALPLAVYFWGPSNFTVIFFLIFAVIWPIFFSIISSLKLIRHDWREAASIFDLTGRPYLTKFLIPITLPGLITGSIIGLGEGWEALIATEIIVGNKTGLGNFFKTFAHDPTITAVGIFGFLLIIFIINKLIWLSLLEWSHHQMET